MVARTLGPLPGFVMLGINVFNNLLFPPVVALGVSARAGASSFPACRRRRWRSGGGAGSTACGLLNIRVNALVTGVFLAVEVAALIAVCWRWAYRTGAVPCRCSPIRSDAEPMALVPASLSAIGLATTIAIFALNGYGMAVYFGEEMHDAHRKIARVILTSFAVSLVLEVCRSWRC
jgi:amino acid transporter